MPITASVLYNLVSCPQRVALDAFGNPAERDEENAFVRLLSGTAGPKPNQNILPGWIER
jgi:hypothetical protein